MEISNCDIGFHSVNMVDSIVDIGFFKYNSGKSYIEDLICKLNNSLSDTMKNKGIKFTGTALSESIDKKAINSKGSVVVTRGKTYMAYAVLNEILINEKFFFDNTELFDLESYRNAVKNLKIKSLKVIEPEIKFGAFGEVLFFARVSLRNECISLEAYDKLCNFLFGVIRKYYKEVVAELCKVYVEVMVDLKNDDANKISLLESFHSDIFKEDTIDHKELKRRCFHSMSWSHYIFSDDIYKSPDAISKFSSVANYDDTLCVSNQVCFSDTKAYIGWSNSVFFTKDKSEEEKRNFTYFYRIPIELEWGEWEFLRNLNRKVDSALYKSYEKLKSKKILFSRLGSYNRSVNNFYFYSRRIIEAYEGLALSVNPTQIKLQEIQRTRWRLDISKDDFVEKLESLKVIIEHLRFLKRDFNSKILNGILFIIAILSVVDISNTIYSIMHSHNEAYMYATIIPASSILVIVLLCYRLFRE